MARRNVLIFNFVSLSLLCIIQTANCLSGRWPIYPEWTRSSTGNRCGPSSTTPPTSTVILLLPYLSCPSRRALPDRNCLKGATEIKAPAVGGGNERCAERHATARARCLINMSSTCATFFFLLLFFYILHLSILSGNNSSQLCQLVRPRRLRLLHVPGNGRRIHELRKSKLQLIFCFSEFVFD